MLKHTILLAAVVGLVFALAPEAQAGTINQFDPLVPSALGLNDTFRLVFVTSPTTVATSNDINYYNKFVNDVANNLEARTGSMFAAYGWSWSVMGSTPTIDARDNTNTTAGGIPIYKVKVDDTLTFTKIVDSFLYQAYAGDSTIYLLNCIDIFESGQSTASRRVWTGNNVDGVGYANYELGDTAGTTHNTIYGNTAAVNVNWTSEMHVPNSTNEYSLYALSEPINIIPEPASLALLLIGLPFVMRRKSKIRRGGRR